SPFGPRLVPYKTRSFSNLQGQENMPPLGAPFVHKKLAPLVHQTSAPFVAQNLAPSANQQPAPFVTTQLVPFATPQHVRFVTPQLVPFVVNQAPCGPRFSPYKKPAYPHPQDQDNAPLPTSFVDRKSVPLVNEHPTPFVDQKTSLRVDQNSHICVDRTGRLFDDRSPSSYADLDLSCPRSEDKLATFKSLGLGWPSSTPLGHPFEIPGPQLRKSNALESHGYHHHDQPSGSHPHEHSPRARDHGYHPYKQSSYVPTPQPTHTPGPQPRKPSALHSVQAHVQQNLKPAAGRAVRYTTPAVVYAPAGAAHVPFVASTGSCWEDEAEKSMYDGAPTDDAALPTVGFDVASWSWGGPARSEGDSGIEDSGAVPGDNSTHKDDASSHGVIFTTHDPTTADTAPSSAERITFLCYRPRRKSIKKAFKILDGLGLPIVDRSKGAARGDERKAGRGDERKAASRANVKMSCDGMADRSKGMADRSRAADGAGVKRVFCGGGKMDCDDMEMDCDDMEMDCDDMDCDDLDCDEMDHSTVTHSITYNTTDAYGYAAFDARLADLESCEAFEKDIDAALEGCASFDALSGCASWGEVEGEVGSFDALAGCANFDLAHKGARSCEGEHSVTSWEGEAAMSLWEDELKSVWDDELESFWDDGEEGGEMDGAEEGGEMDGEEGAEMDGAQEGAEMDDGGARDDGQENGDGCAGGGGAGGEGGDAGDNGERGDDGDGKNSEQGSGDQKEEDSENQDEDHREDQDEDHREAEGKDHLKDDGENSAQHKTKERQPGPATIPFTAAFPFHADSTLPSVNPSAPTTSASPIPRPQ
ncbi:hypothetical protein GGF50DRAFT_27497, partial [Schizophyllum commune]